MGTAMHLSTPKRFAVEAADFVADIAFRIRSNLVRGEEREAARLYAEHLSQDGDHQLAMKQTAEDARAGHFPEPEPFRVPGRQRV